MQGRNQIPPPMRELPLFTPPRVLSSTTPRYVGNVACLAQQAYDNAYYAETDEEEERNEAGEVEATNDTVDF